MNWNAEWIRSTVNMGDVCPVYSVSFACEQAVRSAQLAVTATGVYVAELNGSRVGEFVMAPGWTVYEKRLQVQQYDVTELLNRENTLAVTVARGWYRGRLAGWLNQKKENDENICDAGLTAELVITFEDGTVKKIATDEGWMAAESQVRFSEIYDGETFDASFEVAERYPVETYAGPTETLIPQQGEEVREQERVAAAGIFTTPAGEVVVDFGQEVTGYVEINVEAYAGDVVELSHAEVMDKEGNFYTENYRSAKAKYRYICKDGRQTYNPKLTFFGFRYIRIDSFPGGVQRAKPENFTAVTVHSQMKRTGYLRCSNALLNKLFDNVVWGQKGNFLDVPTDCPQRDERLGWTGDAQAFVRTAALNYDVEKFFTKWLADMAAGQQESGIVGHVVPDVLHTKQASAAWDDAATICPWTIYLAYGNKEILENQFECMVKYVSYITNTTTTPYLWTGGEHFEDWLGLDAPVGSYKGSSRADFIASAFYAYSTELVVKVGKVLGKDMAEHEALYENICKAFREAFPEYLTQTECVLAAHFRIAEDPQKAADKLAELVKGCGTKLQTGFVGTPYILHVLSDYGYTELAYDLLLRGEYPSWLYPVTKGATTIWEHWDGIMENGDFWSADMNSFNHYAYGAVADWVYCQAAGINTVEAYPGYEKVRIAPLPDARLDWLEARLETRHGLVRSRWQKQDGQWKYDIDTPVETEIVIGGKTYFVTPGCYVFYSEI